MAKRLLDSDINGDMLSKKTLPLVILLLFVAACGSQGRAQGEVAIMDRSDLDTPGWRILGRNQQNPAGLDLQDSSWWHDQPVTTDLTLAEMLGAPLSTVSVTYFDQSLFSTFEEAAVEIRSLLRSVVIAPESGWEEPLPFVAWAEAAPIVIEAQVQFSDGRIGLLQSSGSHVCYQDHDGVYWFYRWWTGFPRREKATEGQPSNKATPADVTRRSAPPYAAE